MNKTLAFLMVIGLSGLAFKRSLNKTSTTFVSLNYTMADSPALDTAIVAVPKDTVVVDTPQTATKSKVLYGSASYYHNKFEGRKTSTGEVFRQSGYTAAHRKLPLGTKVKVTNLSNGKQVIVRINDRMGRSNHQIDLTTAAAKDLGFVRAGHTKVSIEIIN